MWGIHTVMPKNDKDQKDRNTNYHHTLDAFAVALCSPSAIQALHNYFKKNENKFKTKALKEKLASNVPISNDGVNVVEHLKALVESYETNALYVCPYNKRKTNMKGFKDGNLKLYVTKHPKDESKEILAEMEKVAVDTSLLIKSVGGFPKPRSDAEVKKEILSIQSRLNPQKQQKIIDAIEIYADELLALRSQINSLDKEIEKQKKRIKTGKQHKEFNDGIKIEMQPFQEKSKSLSTKLQSLNCSFTIKNSKKQIVKTIRLHKVKISKTSADSIMFSKRDEKSIERLSTSNFKQAIENKEPFVIKENESTLCVELYSHPKQNQVVGLKYFSSIVNPHIKTKINEKYGNIFDNADPSLTLYKNDIIKVLNTKDGSENYYLFNGGGDISGSNNKLSIKNINLNNFKKIDKKNVVQLKKIEWAVTTNKFNFIASMPNNKKFLDRFDPKYQKEDAVTPNKTTIVSKVKIDFFGNITEDKQNEK
jgi:hypothetical protein